MNTHILSQEDISFEDFKKIVLNDYKIALVSRECSLLGRREVLTGKAKFGIFGGGKEIPQIAMAKAFEKGDWRSGYYRDQTFMMAIGELTPKQFFLGLYAHPDIEEEPMSGGRQMGGHFQTPSVTKDGQWVNLLEQKNSSADISCTGGQMPRLVGLAQASKIYRHIKEIDTKGFSDNGNEVAWGTIGNASTSEGHFFEAINAMGVLQVPVVMNVWDDDYGISVPNKYQTTKEDISEVLSGFQRTEEKNGYEIFRVKGWNYPELIDVYQRASQLARNKHVPVLIHVLELTQPQGHSTSGSHERYKSEERLAWEKEYDCIQQMRLWMLANDIAAEEDLVAIEKEAKKEVREAKKEAWREFITPVKKLQQEAAGLLANLAQNSANKAFIEKLRHDLLAFDEPARGEVLGLARKSLRYVLSEESTAKEELKQWIESTYRKEQPKFSSHLYSETSSSAVHIKEVLPKYNEDSPTVDGRVVLRDNFDTILHRHPTTLVFGEDAGAIGDVNQGLEGLQEKYGELRVSDTGIREATIVGQGIGMAMRGLRPIAEVQYLDYLLYAIQTLSDDLATLHYRSHGKQIAPLIVRTRGHRLEGIWHSGSPMGGIVHLLRGMNILVPRNMVKAAGFYNTMLLSDEPALIIESLNGYRLKEKLPTNLGEFRTPVGVVETLKEGSDITLVSYGSTLRIVEEVAKELLEVDIDAEVIDVQSLLPFDINHDIVKSVQKTNRLLVIDEDVPGGGSAYILQEILEQQKAYEYLDSAPQTLAAQPHRPAYGTDGDYFSKPNAEDIFEKVYGIMHESNPQKYPKLR